MRPKKKRSRGRARRQDPAAAKTRERTAAIAATVLIGGLALVGRGVSLPGALVTVAGLGWLMFAIHKYGRLGPEAP